MHFLYQISPFRAIQYCPAEETFKCTCNEVAVITSRRFEMLQADEFLAETQRHLEVHSGADSTFLVFSSHRDFPSDQQTWKSCSFTSGYIPRYVRGFMLEVVGGLLQVRWEEWTSLSLSVCFLFLSVQSNWQPFQSSRAWGRYSSLQNQCSSQKQKQSTLFVASNMCSQITSFSR